MIAPRRLLALTAIASALAASSLTAQVARPTVGGSLWLQSYSFGSSSNIGVKSLTQTSFNFSAATPLGSYFSLGVSGAWAKGTMKPSTGGQTSTISGLTDSQVSLTLSPNEFFKVSGVFVAPTGKETQTLDESIVAGAMASDLFPFKVSNWGSGGGGGVNASMVRPLGSVGVGLSVGVIAGRQFEPLDGGQFAYRPGTLVRIVGALDGTVGEAGKASFQLAYHKYGKDQIDGHNLFQSGDRLQALASLAFPVGGGASGITYLSLTHRQHSSLLASLPYAQDFPSQNLFLIGGGFRIPAGSAVWQPDASIRVLRSSNKAGQGFDVGLGTSVELRSGGTVFAPAARIHFGQLQISSGSKGGLFAFELGMTARVRGGS